MQFETSRIVVTGKVQGVGFRPHVYRIAQQYQIVGYVKNRSGDVEIIAQGLAEHVQQFQQAVLQQAPQIARPELVSSESIQVPQQFLQFCIEDSEISQQTDIHLPPDYSLCDACIEELNDPQNTRYQYPFINCTQCGPRYTIIKALPYDRGSTTMADFALCPSCQQQYQSIEDRRFHAEPIACPECGPSLQFVTSEMPAEWITNTTQALQQAIATLRAGRIVAVKGVGGYHLCCDATNSHAIRILRQRKSRPDKPFAVMFPDTGKHTMELLQQWVQLSPVEQSILFSPERPIVLTRKCADFGWPDNIAPELNELGVLLPYSPLHYLLLAGFKKPIICTSANFSGEPVLTDNVECQQRLLHVADAFLHHDRPIERPADDSVVRVIGNRTRKLRMGRGYAPIELTLPKPLAKPVIAVGAQTKNTIALAWDNRVVLSPHIGDLGSFRSLQVFEQTIQDLQRIYQVTAEQVICDQNSSYTASKWAQLSGLPLHQVAHHAAHASALAGEFSQVTRWLTFTWDGVGLGTDGTLWGGEALLGNPGHWQRVASFKPFRLPGADKVSRQPWRTAASLCWHLNQEWDDSAADLVLLKQAWKKGINSPYTSAVGRLFDAAACLTDLVDNTSFEGQGPMLLEAIAAGQALVEPVTLPLVENSDGLWCSDWQPLIEALLDQQIAVERRAMQFHLSLANAIVDQAFLMRDLHGDFVVGLTGGVFQNRLLGELAQSLLEAHDFKVQMPRQLPCNDGAISYGQIIDFLYQNTER